MIGQACLWGQSPLPYVVPEEERYDFFAADQEVAIEVDRDRSTTSTATIEQTLETAFARSIPDSTSLNATSSESHSGDRSVSLQALAELVKKGIYVEQISVPHSLAQIGTGSLSAQAALSATAIERDPDDDGLTTTEERWWGTNPYVADTDGDGFNDGEEIRRARAGDHSAGIPWPNWPIWGQRPNANIGWGWGDDTDPPIIDLDQDCIPDAAELFVLGFNQNYESTDNDRYDDGQEFWGITQIGRGALPRAVDSDFLLAEMPNFVDAPGRSPLATAYPKIEIDVDNSTIKVITRQTIKTENKEIREQENIYEVETTNFNEVSQSSFTSLNEIHSSRNFRSETQEPPPPPPAQMDVEVEIAGNKDEEDETPPITDAKFNKPESGLQRFMRGATFLGPLTPIINPQAAIVTGFLLPDIMDVVEIQKERSLASEACEKIVGGLAQSVKVNSFSDKVTATSVAAAAGAGIATVATGGAAAPVTAVIGGLSAIGAGAGYLTGSLNKGRTRNLLEEFREENCDDQGYDFSPEFINAFPGLVLAHRELSGQANHFQLTPLATTTESEETSRSENRSEKRFSSRNSTRVRTRNFQRMFTRDEWSKATTVDTRHAADLVFNLTIANQGTDVVRSINSVVLNIFIGDDEVIDYTTNLLGSNSTINQIENLFPGDVFRINLPVEIPLTLDQTKAIDTGDEIHVIIERIEYGDDQLFYENAYTGGVYFLIDDGIDDGDPSLVPFLLPTWGDETYLEVLNRVTDVFRLNFRNQGLESVDVPLFDAQHRIAGFNTLPNGGKQQWLVFSPGLSGSDFSTMEAQPESTMIFVFQKDEDEDGFIDTEEVKFDTNYRDPLSYPEPKIIGAVTNAEGPNGNIFASLILENQGNYPATGLEAVMYSPDGSQAIEKNFTGGGGILLPGQRVVIGPRFLAPNLSDWSGDSLPVISGVYEGSNDLLFVGTVINGGNVGSDNVVQIRVAWLDQEVLLDLGTTGPDSRYLAPQSLAIGNTGLSLGFTSGFLVTGEGFSIEASAFGDAFEHLENPRPIGQSDALTCLKTPFPTTDQWLFDQLGLEIPSTGELATTMKLNSQRSIREDGLLLQGGQFLIAPATGELERYSAIESTYRIVIRTSETLSGTLVDQGNRELFLDSGKLMLGMGPQEDGSSRETTATLVADRLYEIITTFSLSSGTTLDVVGLVRLLDGDGETQVFRLANLPLPSQSSINPTIQLCKKGFRGAQNFVGHLKFFSYLDSPRSACFDANAPAEEAGLPPSIVLSYNTPQGHFRQQITAKVNSRTAPLVDLASSRGTSLNLAAYPFLDPTSSNQIHAQIYCGDSTLKNANLYFNLIDPALEDENVVWSQELSQDFQRGWNYANITLDLSQLSSEIGKRYHLYAVLTDQLINQENATSLNGNVIDEALITLVRNPNTPTDVTNDLQLSTKSLSSPNLHQGNNPSKSVVFANTSDIGMNLVIPLADARISSSLLNNSIQLASGESRTIKFALNTIGLESGEHAFTIPLETNGRTASPITWSTSILEAPNDDRAVPQINPRTPWTIPILVKGLVLPGETLSIDLGSDYDLLDFEAIRLLDDEGVIGNGPMTSFAGKPIGAYRNQLNPSLYHFKVPEEIPTGIERSFTLEIGRILFLNENESPLTITPMEPHNRLESLSVSLPVQSVAPFPFHFSATSSVDPGEYSYDSNLSNSEGSIRLQVRHKTDDTGAPRAASIESAESLLVAKLDGLDIEYSSEEANDLVLRVVFRGGNSLGLELPRGAHLLQLSLNYESNTADAFVDGILLGKLQIGTGNLIIYLTHTNFEDSVPYNRTAHIHKIMVEGQDILAFQRNNLSIILDADARSNGASGVSTGTSLRSPLSPLLPWRISARRDQGATLAFDHMFSANNVSELTLQFEGQTVLTRTADDLRIPIANESNTLLEFDRIIATPRPKNIVLTANQNIIRTIPLDADSAGSTEIMDVWKDVDLNSSSGKFTLVNSSGNLGGLKLLLSKLRLAEAVPHANLVPKDFALTTTAPSNGFLPNSTVSFNGTINNNGANDASFFTVSFYAGNPANDGILLGSSWIDQAIPGSEINTPGEHLIEGQITLPGKPGPYSIFVSVDPFNNIPESNENDNIDILGPQADITVAYPKRFAIDSGSTEGDPAYDSFEGFGYLNGVALALGQGDGDVALETSRFAVDGVLEYRFDQLDPDAAYNVDLAFRQPDLFPVRYQVFADKRLMSVFTAAPDTGFSNFRETIDVNTNNAGSTVFATGFLSQDAVADGSVTITIRSVNGSPVTLSQIQLQRGGRIFIDSGSPAEAAWSSNSLDPETGIRFGYDDSDPNHPSFGKIAQPGGEPSRRFAPRGRIAYRFGNLEDGLDYVLRPVVNGLEGSFQAIAINGQRATPPIALDSTLQQLNLLVSETEVRANGGELLVEILRVDSNGTLAPGTAIVVDMELNEFTGSSQIQQDSDQDELPDWFELLHSSGPLALNPIVADADQDLDGDGLSALEEFRGGSDPQNAESVLGFRNLAMDRAQKRLNLEWQGVAGRNYQLEYSPDGQTNWQPIAQSVQRDPAAIHQSIIDLNQRPHGFVRIRARHRFARGSQTEATSKPIPFYLFIRALGSIKLASDGQTSLDGVTFELANGTQLGQTTGADGSFNLEVHHNGPFKLRPRRDGFEQAEDGVDIFDVVALLNKLRGRLALSAEQNIAADVNRDGSIDAEDLQILGEVILRKADHFSKNQAGKKEPTWRFIRKGHRFNDPTKSHEELLQNPDLESVVVESPDSSFSIQGDFLGIKLGDVNGDWQP